MLPDIKIAQINTFLTVAQCKNFRQAASLLCRSQPAVSLAIKQLEQSLGAALFNPERHGELSAFGMAFYLRQKPFINIMKPPYTMVSVWHKASLALLS